MENSNTLLQQRIETLFDELNNVEAGSEEATVITRQITDLYKIQNEEYDLITANQVKEKEVDIKAKDYEVKQAEIEIKKKELEEVIKSNHKKWIEYGLTAISIAAPLCCYGYWYKTGLTFETEGTVTSSWVKNLMGKMKPTK